MDHLEFFKYHNRLIQFDYNGAQNIGVVLDAIPYKQKNKETEYAFIPQEYLETYRNASNYERVLIQRTIDIEFIHDVELL